MKSWVKKVVIAFVVTLVLEFLFWIFGFFTVQPKCKLGVPCPPYTASFFDIFMVFLILFVVILILVFLISWIVKKVRG